jgi:alpha-1,3-rhamnosyl/mannosyltransferase
MACGTPVVCSDAASMPEIAGDAARLVAVDDREALAEALLEIVSDGELSRRMIEAGLRRAAGFSWHETARRTLEVYRRLAEGFYERRRQ